MKSDQREAVEKELKKLKSRGLTRAEDVVEFARNPKTALHSEFEWDDTKAAQEYRIWQARKIIIDVMILPSGTDNPVRAYVSLKSDRKSAGGGYRDVFEVLSDSKLREELLKQAFADFKYWQSKYEVLVELSPIFVEAKKIESKIAKPHKRRRKLAKV